MARLESSSATRTGGYACAHLGARNPPPPDPGSSPFERVSLEAVASPYSFLSLSYHTSRAAAVCQYSAGPCPLVFYNSFLFIFSPALL